MWWLHGIRLYGLLLESYDTEKPWRLNNYMMEKPSRREKSEDGTPPCSSAILGPVPETLCAIYTRARCYRERNHSTRECEVVRVWRYCCRSLRMRRMALSSRLKFDTEEFLLSGTFYSFCELAQCILDAIIDVYFCGRRNRSSTNSGSWC